MPPPVLTRYIAFRTLAATGTIVAVFTALIFMIDLVENMRFAEKLPEHNFTFALILSLLRLPALVQILAPLLFLFASTWMFHRMNSHGELSVMRATGLSVWQIMAPATAVAFIAGTVLVSVVDPVASQLDARAETLRNTGKNHARDDVRISEDGLWFQQADGSNSFIINARNINIRRNILEKIRIWHFDASGHYLERITAEKAFMSDRTLALHEVRITPAGTVHEVFRENLDIHGILYPGTPGKHLPATDSISLRDLPGQILLARTAGLPATEYIVRFHDLASMPLKLVAMVLTGAAFSLQPPRSHSAILAVTGSLAAGFALYVLTEISFFLTEATTMPAMLAAWGPVLAAMTAAVTVLLHIEDG